MEGRHLRPCRRRAAVVALGVGLGLLTAGCSSGPATSQSTTTTSARHPKTEATTTTTSTTVASSTTTAPPVQSASAQIQIAGSSATITFSSSDISGSISPETGTFTQGGTVYTFAVSGVQFTGSPTTASATSGLISAVTVSTGSAGTTVTVKLTSPSDHASYGLGHNEIGVTFS